MVYFARRRQRYLACVTRGIDLTSSNRASGPWGKQGLSGDGNTIPRRGLRESGMSCLQPDEAHFLRLVQNTVLRGTAPLVRNLSFSMSVSLSVSQSVSR